MKNIKYLISILIILTFVSCEKRNMNIENISVEVRNESDKSINNFCLSDRDGQRCIDEIKVNESKKMKLTIIGESSLNLSYSINEINIYDNFDMGFYIDSDYFGFVHFIIKDKKVIITENISTGAVKRLEELDKQYEKKFIIDNHKIIE